MCSHTHTLCPHTPTTICVLILILPYMCPHTHANHTCVHVSSYVSSYSAYLYVSSYSYCHILPYMCPHTHASIHVYMCPHTRPHTPHTYMCPHTHTTIHVSSYSCYHTCVLILVLILRIPCRWTCPSSMSVYRFIKALFRLYSGSIQTLLRLY
jgi:hypothetical protein